LEAALAADPDRSDVVAVVATAGTTNAGIIDDLESTSAVADGRGLWFHVDGAYGAAALAAPSARPLFAGIERADSLVVDPHKWLFDPFDWAAVLLRRASDGAAVLSRRPSEARAPHTQHAEYLDVLTERPEWNPSEYAFHLSRRARGLP